MSTSINIKKKLAILDEGASVTTDANSIDFVGSGVSASNIDGDVTITIPGGSGNTTYYLNQSVTQTPYKEFSSIATAAAEQVVPLTVSAGATSVIAEFQTISGVPGTTQIPGGLWQFFLHFNAGAAGQNWIIRPTVYKRNLAGTETLLFTPDPEIVTGMSTTTTMYVCDGVFPPSTILTTDRIVVRISMQNTTGVSQTVNFRTEGSQHYSVGLTTLNQVIPTGAVTSVTGTAPIVSSGGLTPAISIAQATGSTDGYLSSSDWSVFNAKVPATRNITINGTTFDLSADRTWNVGTVTSVAALTLGTTGTDVSSSVATGTTTPVITLNIPDASATARGLITINAQTINGIKTFGSNPILPVSAYVTPVDFVGINVVGTIARISAANARTAFGQSTTSTDGYLSSTDWTTFNGKLGGSGTTNYLSKFTGTSSLGDSLIQDDGTTVGVNTTPGTISILKIGNSTKQYSLDINNTTVTTGIKSGIRSLTTGTNSTGFNSGGSFSASNNTLLNIGVSGEAQGTSTANIGGLFSATGATSNYSLQLTDGTEGVGKVLTSMTADGKAQWTALSTSIPQAQVLYVDSANGINATTGRGDINTPYLTPEYALSNITNTGTITANTATNTTLSAISDVNNALLEIGMYVSGTGIPFGTIIVAKGNQGGNANTVTLSKLTTATATGVTVTWVKTYEVILNGSFVVASSLFKEGMYINPQSAEISWGAFTLFNIDTYVNKIPYYILGQGNYFGTSISSVFILTNATQSQGYSLSVNFGNIETIGTSYCIYLTSGSNENYINILGNFVNARFGRVCFLDGGTSSLTFNSYGLLGGFTFGFIGGKRLLGTHTTPTSVGVLSSGYGTTSLATLTGSTTWTGQSSHRGVLNGTTHTLGGTVDVYSTAGGGTVTVNGGENTFTAVTGYTLNVDSGCVCYAYGSGSYIFNAISGSLFFYGFNSSSTISGSGTINNYGYIYVISMGSFTGTFNNWGTVSAGSFGGSGNVNNYGSITMIYYGIGVAANKTFINRGTIISNGSLLNSNAIITLTSATSTFENYGSIINNTTDITKAIIEKTAGKLYLRQGSYLKVANGKSPIKCTANTSASKDVYYFGVTDNCDGTTYGLSIAFDGTSFAPNDLVGGTLYENINY